MKTKLSTISEDDRLLIISANSGGGGWRMARLACCHSNVYWYTSKSNGQTPWDMTNDFSCTERLLAPNHFDRTLPCGNVMPIFGERISRFWDDNKWINKWRSIYNRLELPNKKLVYVSHDSPKEIRSWFPNCTIINIYEEDSSNSAKWHIKTSSNYRINHHYSGMKPDYKNNYQIMLDYIIQNKIDSSFKDIWLYQTHRTLTWSNELIDLYHKHEYQQCENENKLRQSQQELCDVNITWNTFDLSQLKVLGKLNGNFSKVFRNPRL